MYQALDSEAIVATCENLRKRIAERFPGSGLSRVTVELLAVARESAARIDRVRRPNWPLVLTTVNDIQSLAIGLSAKIGRRS